MLDNQCDARCPARALETWMHDGTGDMLRFCRHHSRDFDVALYGQGFRLFEVERVPTKSAVTQDA